MNDTGIRSQDSLVDGLVAMEVKGNVSPENQAKGEVLKEKANEAFKAQHYPDAIELYTKAIELNPTVAVYYGNRSMAHLKMELYGYALNDADEALALDKNYIKAYYRRASANLALGKFEKALKDFETVKRVRPNDKDALTKFNECKKIVMRMRFEKAISVDEKTRNVVAEVELDTIVVEDSYEGPVLEAGRVTMEFMRQLLPYFRDQKRLHKRYAYQILLQVYEILKELPSLVDITVPSGHKFTVCGDVHGQFYDLLNIFELNGLPSQENPYLFNGDFVDRGSYSVEVILTLFSFKLLFPNHFFLSRGNHESETMNKMYGFEGEVRAKYNQHMADLFTEVYNFLPLCHCINKKVLVMHGGLFSEDGVTLDSIRVVDRHRQPPESGIMCELLWSDPQPQNGRAPSKRGVGVQFGPDVTKRFLEHNRLDYIIRSHEVKQEGYEEAHDGKCITVFSAPNYCDTMGNKGAFITLTGDDLTPRFTTFNAVDHPKVKPMAYANMMHIFDMFQ